MAEIDNEHLDVVKRHNKALRTVNKQLRRALLFVVDYADNLFVELCESGTEAQLALEELRLRGDIDCSPQDYQQIVELAVEALQQQRRNSTQVV